MKINSNSPDKVKSSAQTELNLICTLLIASLVDKEANLPLLAFHLVINYSVETCVKHTAFIDDAFNTDEDCGHRAKTC